MSDTIHDAVPQICEVPFHDARLITFEHDGQPYVAMRLIVEGMGLSWGGQRDKLIAETQKFSCTDIRTTGRDGKEYKMLSIPVAKLPLWLASINPNKIRDLATREKVELYQAESAICLHDYWTKGAAVRDNADGIVGEIDPKLMRAIDGMVTSIVSKALQAATPALVEQMFRLDPRLAAVEAVTAYQIAVDKKVPQRGRRRIVGYISGVLARFCEDNGYRIHRDPYGRRLYPRAAVDQWLAGGGWNAVERYMTEVAGQGRLHLVSPAK